MGSQLSCLHRRSSGYGIASHLDRGCRSGSCWTIAAYYTLAYHDFSRLTKHYLRVAEELGHPISIQALNTVARSSKGVYFSYRPSRQEGRERQYRAGDHGSHAALTTAYQFLSREPRARLSRATFQFSKVWTRSGLDKETSQCLYSRPSGEHPGTLPGSRPHADSSNSKGRPPRKRSLSTRPMYQVFYLGRDHVRERLRKTPGRNPGQLSREWLLPMVRDLATRSWKPGCASLYPHVGLGAHVRLRPLLW